DAWTAFDLGGEANVEKAIRLMKESLELVDLAANRRGLKTFEEELEALRNPAPTPPTTATQPPRQVAQNADSTSGDGWNRAERVAADASDSGTSGRTSAPETSSTFRTSERASSVAANAPERRAQNSASSSGQTSSGTISSSPSSAQTSSGTISSSSASVAWTDAPAAGTVKSLAIKGAPYNFRYCPAGTFTMGSPASEPGRFADETQHEVRLTRGFWMLETEVTQALWESVMGENPVTIDRLKGPNKPVGNVSWEDCQEFIAKLNSDGYAPSGLKFRLPTEAEWEYACRAGTSGPYAGSSLDTMGWYKDNSGGDNRDVGKKAPNAWGLYDMHGNLWEWCADWFGTYDTASQTEPSSRVLRGGSWRNVAEHSRSANRNFSPPRFRNDHYGFRLVLGREIASVATSDASTSSTSSAKRTLIAFFSSSSDAPTSSTSIKILLLCVLSFYLIYAKRLRRRLDFSRLSADGETGERSAEGAARFKRLRRRRARTETSGDDETDGRDAANGR
ncbi:MAG: formylglycine-generating enzyme family protein, partial [Thermoguttaceae bacterium]|nr:formylglycine-generating enzyme family protein [Thermoguttaceae bacterium]